MNICVVALFVLGVPNAGAIHFIFQNPLVLLPAAKLTPCASSMMAPVVRMVFFIKLRRVIEFSCFDEEFMVVLINIFSTTFCSCHRWGGALAKLRSEIIFRGYLAADMEFLVPDLVEQDCEVHLMKSSSVRHSPEAMWRFLALEHDGFVTITDSDRPAEVIRDLERTEELLTHGLGHWRVPYITR